MTSRRERKGSLLPQGMMAQKTTPNPSAVPLDQSAATATPVQTVEPSAPAENTAAVESASVKSEPGQQAVQELISEPVVESAPASAVVAAPAATKSQDAQVEVSKPEPATPVMSALDMIAPKHRRSTKEKSSQMSCQVPPKLYKLIDNARREVQGLSGQTIILEGMVMWLVHNEFITPQEGAEFMKNPV